MNIPTLSKIFLGLMGIVLCGRPAESGDAAQVYAAAKKSIIQIEALNAAGRPFKQGSGFLVSNNGRILTNYHVISHALGLRIRLVGGEPYDNVTVLGVDKVKDLALIEIPGTDFSPIRIGESSSIAVGVKIFVLGNPLGLQDTISEGIVSGIRSFEGLTSFQISAPISPGSSGGPVLTDNGSVIGIAAATMSSGQNLNFAIPIDYAKALLANESPKSLNEIYEPDPTDSDQETIDLAKVERYVKLEMYPEATAAVEAALKQREFDPHLRFIYGDILLRQKKYADALKQFELWSRLDPESWEALQHIATIAQLIRLGSMSLPDENAAKPDAWRKAYSSWRALANFNGNTTDRLQPAELLKAQTIARDMIKGYETPVGIWQSTGTDGKPDYFVINEKSPGQYNFYIKNGKGIDILSAEPLPKFETGYLKETIGSPCDGALGVANQICMTLEGHEDGQVYQGCICAIDYKATVLYGYTALRLGGQIRKVYGPNNPNCRALREWGPVDRVFEYLTRVE